MLRREELSRTCLAPSAFQVETSATAFQTKSGISFLDPYLHWCLYIKMARKEARISR